MSSLTSNSLFCLFSPKLSPLNPSKSKFLSSYKFTLSNPISFQTLTTTNTSSTSPPPLHPIKSQSQTLTPNLPKNLQDIITLFQSVPDNRIKHQQLLAYATRLPPFPNEFRNNAHRVGGCVSQVWVHAYPDPADPSRVRFDADSDSQLTKGLAALLVLGLSGEPPAVIAAVSPDFVCLLGQSLSPSRNNGFLNMLKKMQDQALRIAHGGDEQQLPVSDLREEDGDVKSGVGSSVEAEEKEKEEEEEEEEEELREEDGDVKSGIGSSVEADEKEEELVDEEEEEEEGVSVNGIGDGGRGRKVRIREKLERVLSPTELEVDDISHLHAGHAGVRGPTGGETHFNVRIISEEFRDKSMVKRHRLVYDILREELESGLHALSIIAKTPTEN